LEYAVSSDRLSTEWRALRSCLFVILQLRNDCDFQSQVLSHAGTMYFCAMLWLRVCLQTSIYLSIYLSIYIYIYIYSTSLYYSFFHLITIPSSPPSFPTRDDGEINGFNTLSTPHSPPTSLLTSLTALLSLSLDPLSTIYQGNG